MHFKKVLLLIITLTTLFVEPVLAVQVPEKVPTIGQIAEKLIVGTEFLTRLILVACFTLGVILIISAITFFKAHHRNPKFVPLDRPFFLLLFGIILIAIPFLGDIFAPTGSVLELRKQETKAKMAAPVDIDAPLELGNEYDH